MNLRQFYTGRATGFLIVLGLSVAFYSLNTYIYHEKQGDGAGFSLESAKNTKSYASSVYGLSFTYPDTYVLSETDAPGSAQRHHHAIVLIPKGALPLPEAGEGPPSITIDIYQNNLDKQTTEGWIRNTSASNFKLGEGILTETTISGLPALSYRWSGLYEGTTIALARMNWVYVFTVTYLEIGAPIVQDFVAIRDSVRLSE